MTDRPDPLPVEPASRIDATVSLPGSKSITNRALVCAALADGPTTIRGWLDADDTSAMIDALRTMGVAVAVGDDLGVAGGGPSDDVVSLDARQSGTTGRFLLPMVALDGTTRRITGDPQLLARPMDDSFAALRTLGARVDEEGVIGCLPAVVEGPLRGGSIDMPGDTSSQFLSGLLLAAPHVAGGIRVRITTPLVSRPYVDMTAAVMYSFGADVQVDADGVWAVPPARYTGCEYTVEPDASAASYAWGAAVIAGGAVTVSGLHRSSIQGDVRFVEILERMGARVRWDDDAVTVASGDRLRGIEVDLADLSDTVPTLAAVAAFADGPTTIHGVGFIRGKESDRIAATVAELRRCGVDAAAHDDGLVITPGPLRGAVVETYDDHRIAMAFSLIGLRQPGIVISNPGCVAKTFPGFWDLLDRLRSGAGPTARAV